MKILVTGCAGFIGSVVCEYLVDAGHAVVGIDNFQTSYPEAVHPKIKFYRGSLESKYFLSKVLEDNNIELVCHLAAESIIGKANNDPAIFFRGNVVYSLNLFDAMKENGVKNLVLASTGSIYGEPEYTPMDESHPINPINAYGESKFLVERMLDWYWKAYDFSCIIFRFYNVGGSTQMNGERRKDESRLIPIALDAVFNHKTIPIFGTDYKTPDGTAIRDYVHVRDVASAFLLAVNSLKDGYHIYQEFNLGSDAGFSVKTIIDKVMQYSRKFTTVYPTDRRPGDPSILIADSTLANELLGWRARHSSIDEIVYDSVVWYEKNLDKRYVNGTMGV